MLSGHYPDVTLLRPITSDGQHVEIPPIHCRPKHRVTWHSCTQRPSNHILVTFMAVWRKVCIVAGVVFWCVSHRHHPRLRIIHCRNLEPVLAIIACSREVLRWLGVPWVVAALMSVPCSGVRSVLSIDYVQFEGHPLQTTSCAEVKVKLRSVLLCREARYACKQYMCFMGISLGGKRQVVAQARPVVVIVGRLEEEVAGRRGRVEVLCG
mmetsp:Transcript_27233/g.33075  ORF Transcript_27233/g.33075 Transcript_27233/m.33075 type:complete len:209 (+) Transcript_27233:1192-1818(+)